MVFDRRPTDMSDPVEDAIARHAVDLRRIDEGTKREAARTLDSLVAEGVITGGDAYAFRRAFYDTAGPEAAEPDPVDGRFLGARPFQRVRYRYGYWEASPEDGGYWVQLAAQQGVPKYGMPTVRDPVQPVARDVLRRKIAAIRAAETEPEVAPSFLVRNRAISVSAHYQSLIDTPTTPLERLEVVAQSMPVAFGTAADDRTDPTPPNDPVVHWNDPMLRRYNMPVTHVHGQEWEQASPLINEYPPRQSPYHNWKGMDSRALVRRIDQQYSRLASAGVKVTLEKTHAYASGLMEYRVEVYRKAVGLGTLVPMRQLCFQHPEAPTMGFETYFYVRDYNHGCCQRRAKHYLLKHVRELRVCGSEMHWMSTRISMEEYWPYSD